MLAIVLYLIRVVGLLGSEHQAVAVENRSLAAAVGGIEEEPEPVETQWDRLF
jgi:hypothetical protein